MRIAILSLVPGHNYGGILQSFALQTVLERMGHEVKVISKVPSFKETGWKKYIKYGVRFVKKYILRTQKDLPIKREKFYTEKRKYELQKTLVFVDEYLHIRYIDKFEDIKEGEFEAFVVGSDQVWRPQYFCGQYNTEIENAFLKFTEGWKVKRISYAASFGVDFNEYSTSQTKSCRELLKKFDAVSVREDSGIKLCYQLFDVPARKVCDPTMLLSKEDYLKLIDCNIPKSSGNLFVYCLDRNESLDKIVSEISSEKNLVPFFIRDDDRVKPSVESWLQAFNDAEFVVTDSFHACVFSLIFKKPFIVIGNKDRGMSRFDSLLVEFGMKERLVLSLSDNIVDIEDLKIDGVDPVFEKIRKESYDFLHF